MPRRHLPLLHRIEAAGAPSPRQRRQQFTRQQVAWLTDTQIVEMGVIWHLLRNGASIQ